VSHEAPPRSRDEVRLADYAERVARRWYVVVLAILVALGLVLLNALGGGTTYQAQATVSLGQPLTPGGGALLAQNTLTSPTNASQFVRSDQVVGKAARAAGLQPSQLRSRLSVTSSGTATPAKTVGPTTMTITVRGPSRWKRDQLLRATASLGRSLIGWANTYQDAKIKLLNGQIAAERKQIDALQLSIDEAKKSLNQISSSGISAVDKAAITAPLISTIANAGGRIDDITSELTSNELFVTTATTIESAAFVQDPSVHKSSSAGKKSAMIVAAFAGLIVGVILALGWDAVRSRRV
jgi:uncharacterized protein involved in exopolysaccharide biosynthesis